ncbi:hypothetical protein PG995_005772 [Apiospora arundinis]
MTPGNASSAFGDSNNPAKLSQDVSEDAFMDNKADDVFATPQHSGVFMAPGSVSVGRRPQTRSMTKGSKTTTIFAQLETGSSRPKRTLKLEDSRDIDYSTGQSTGNFTGDSTVFVNSDHQARMKKTRVGPLRKSPSSRRKIDLNRDSTPAENNKINSSSGASSETPRKRRRTMADTHPQSLPLRRSKRLSKPLTEFQKYAELPNELKLAIWEAASAPRLVYIRNRTAPNFGFDVQNAAPTWFETDVSSAEVSSKRYRKMFGHRNPVDNRTVQYVNPNADIVLLEPCCSGCRGYHCVRNQFTETDREAIRHLAVQTESIWLTPATMACWETISLAWPNVETLYLVQMATTVITGDNKVEKALVRLKEEAREQDLRKRFDVWKKTEHGKDRALFDLEFVAVVPKSNNGYKDVAKRRTGGSDDIIIG